MDEVRKVLDRTVREIKREVNLKVLKVPEIEQKVLDATSDEPWGPHGSDLADIARATRKFEECQIIMNVLWQRLGDSSASWRHLYKTLAVIEYLLANGTERAVDEIIDNSSHIEKLTRFKYVEPNGKDVGLNVRKKVETVLAIVDDREKLQQVREKAAATRDKYLGLSSTGITCNSSAASFGNGSYSSGTRYGRTGGSGETASFKDSYTSTEWSKTNKETMSSYSSTRQRSKETTKSATSYNSAKGDSKSLSNLSATCGVPSSQKGQNEDDGDNFNPRGSSTSAGRANASSNHVDLFGPSLMDDLAVTAVSTKSAILNVGTAAVPEVDLFADADFQSANTPLVAATGSRTQDNIDLFAGRSSVGGSYTADTEFSVRGSPNKSSEKNLSSPEHPSGSAFDPFLPSFATSFPSDTAFSVHDTPGKSSQGKTPTPEQTNAVFDPFAIPLKSFDASDSFGAFSSSTGSAVTELTHDSFGGVKNSEHSPSEELNFGAFTSHTESHTAGATESMNTSSTKLEHASMSESRPGPAVKKETFQVKSTIWSDSLSRGLIDLNITTPKKADLSDVGVVGQLSDGSEEKGPAAPWYTRATTGTRPGLVSPGFLSSTRTTGGSSHFQQQQQFENFK